MKKINWILLKSNDRGIDYGVGSFLKHMSKGLSNKNNINVIVLEIGISKNESFAIKKQDEMTIIQIPVITENMARIDTRTNHEKLSKNIARVVSQYLQNGCKSIIHMNYLFQYFIARALKERLLAKIIFTQHILDYNSQVLDNHFDTESETYRLVDKIIAVTHHGKNHLTKKGVARDKIIVIHNGVDPVHFKNRNSNGIIEKYGLRKEEKLILYSGRLDVGKGLEYLGSAMISVVDKIPNYRLVIAGNGNFEQLIDSTRSISANVSYLGFIPFEDLLSLYQIADVGVIPSLEEQCSYVALEMLHSGLPVVASNIGGLKEIFIHGKNAFLVNSHIDKTSTYGIALDVEEFEKHMYKLLTNEKLKTNFSHNAVVRANEEFTLDIMINNYLQIIENFN